MHEFRPFRLDIVNLCVWRRKDSVEDEPIVLRPTAFAILRYLVEHAGRLVTQEEILDAIWPDTHVQPDVLKRHILDIRRALGDDPRNPNFIETLPRRGYQFIAAVTVDASGAPDEPARPWQDRLVGRDDALGELRDYLRRANAGQRQIVFVTGEPGIGKTAFVDEFQRQAGADAALRHARGQCVDGYGGMEAYYPVLEALGKLCRRAGGDQVVQALALQAPTWLVQFPALVARSRRETLWRELMGATRERMLREIGEALETVTAKMTILLVLEDLQWVDPSTVDLISALARGRASARLMVIGTYRPRDLYPSEHPLNRVKQDLMIHGLCREIALGPLSETDIGEFMSDGAMPSGLPVGLAGLVHRHSGGNPLFMLATLEHMKQRGCITHENGNWELIVPLEEIDLEVPENLKTMIEAQIDRLSAEEQRALEAASVSGISFTANVNAAAASMDEERFEDLCDVLARRQYMVRWAGSHRFPGGIVARRYEFAHILYREVFYRRQTAGRRAKLHLYIGERLEALYAKHEKEVAPELADHFEEASDWPRTVKYMRMIADSARRRYAHREAVAILQLAVGLVNRLPETDRFTCEIEILEQLATFYVAFVDISAALETFQKLIALAHRHGLIDVEVRALVNMALPTAWTSAQLYIETVERALQLSTRLEDPLMRARTRAWCFGWRAVAGRWSREDAESCWQAMAEIERIGDRIAIEEHRLQCTYVQFFSSQHADAHRCGRGSLAFLFNQDDLNPYLSAFYEINRYFVFRNHLLWGELGQALSEVEATIALCRKNGDYTRAKEMVIYRAWTHFHAMDFSGVVTICDSISVSARIPQAVRLWHTLIGAAEAALGNDEAALNHLRNVKEAMDRQPLMSDWHDKLPLEAAFTELRLRQGDLAQARQEAERFIDSALATDDHTYQGMAWDANARVAMAMQEWKDAEEYIGRALSTIDGYEIPLAAWRVHGTAAELYEHAGCSDLAKRHLEFSRETIMKLADSLKGENSLRATFLTASSVRGILNKGMAHPRNR